MAADPTTPRINARSMPQAEARRRFDYDAATGNLIWKRVPDRLKQWNTKFAGKVAGCVKIDLKKYVVIGMGNRLARAHRIIWSWHYGDIPPGMEIDHIDGNGLNNRIENLRLASRTENMRNQRRRSSSTTGITGVSWQPSRQRYAAYGHVNGKLVSFGRFATLEEAAAVRRAWERENGYHVNHGSDRPL